MDANSLNQVVDKVAEKLGIAVEKAAPIAEQVVKEYAARAEVGAVACAVVGIVGFLMLIAGLVVLSWSVSKDNPLGSCLAFASALMGAIGAITGTANYILYRMEAVAPTYYVLKELLR